MTLSLFLEKTKQHSSKYTYFSTANIQHVTQELLCACIYITITTVKIQPWPAYITGNIPAEDRSTGQCEGHFKWKISIDVTRQPYVCDFEGKDPQHLMG